MSVELAVSLCVRALPPLYLINLYPSDREGRRTMPVLCDDHAANDVAKCCTFLRRPREQTT